MKKSTENNNKKNFLKEGFKGDISKHHKESLGTTIPEGYFAKSKMSILDKIKEEAIIEVPKETKKQNVFWIRPQFRYMAAASLVFILSLTIWLQSADNNNVDENNIEFLSFSDDNLINSLLIDDSEFEAFADATLINEVLIKAELSEQVMDDLFLNSLFVEDSLIDDYTDDKFLEIIIL
ncbi:hypothetical protein [Polaribacter sp. SA4-12]|uniref:hypothetical protein n=1 Tax=Polaribacter sp. SA4-12 TaxID=1312072 RepID=UPI000B3C85B0|nr:hypothetical protein [Polaribacter sp. SA4-12]ARV14983.1 hypothetical protein BTO07_07405 [Polaribacter sp. SA4-12]